jgi:hypothetical protein
MSGNNVKTPGPVIKDTSTSRPNKSKTGGGNPMAGKMNTSNKLLHQGIASVVSSLRPGKP